MYKRLFIAIKINPTEEILRRILFLKNNLSEENINWIKEDHYHLTLQFLGKTPVNLIPNICQDLKKAIGKIPKHEIQLNKLGMFGSTYNPKVLWFGFDKHDELSNLHTAITISMKKFGFLSDRQNYVPHLSIARIRKLNNKDHFKKVFERAEQDVSQKHAVQEVVLFESIMHPKGAEYQVVEKFQLL